MNHHFMVHYSDGADFCRTNSARLENSARIILSDSDGTDSFGLFLYHIAYEEMAKAIFCLFVERNWVDESFVTKVFKDHKAKIFLFEEIFRSFAVISGQGHLGCKKLGEIHLDKFIEEHIEKIVEHRKITNDFLYVGKTDEWKVPEFEIENIQEREKEIQLKIKALDTIFEYIREKLDGQYSHNNNFKFYEDENRNFVIRWDSI
jgi:AbiV family abortive infection protein